MKPSPSAMTTPQVAKRLGVSGQRVRQLISEGKLPAEKSPYGPGVWLITENALREYEESKN